MNSPKELTRKQFLMRRLALSGKDHHEGSLAIQEKIIDSPAFVRAKRLALYDSFRKEVATRAILHRALEQNKEVYYPIWDAPRKHIHFVQVKREADLHLTEHHISEPVEDEDASDPLSFDLLLIPGVCFDLLGNRLGYGQGGYDRVLTNITGLRWGLAFEFQLVDTLPRAPHDVPCHCIITEKRVYEIS
jgi:5-formyltetrahydrofolate cyclo-ligase